MPSRPFRVAVGGFLHETNTFAPSPATLRDFEAGAGHFQLSVGAEIPARARGCNQAVAGAIEAGERLGWEIVPTLWAGVTPSAHVTREAYESIVGRLIARIADAGPLDGVHLDLHGAMVAEHVDDGEGELLARLRAVVGRDLPVVVSLDLHANVTPLMAAHATVLDSYRTYPHIDMTETGRRGAAILDRLMREGGRPERAFLQAPFLTAVTSQCTEMEPARSLYALRAELERGLVSISLNMGFPAADFPDCGMSVTAYGPGAGAAARRLMDALEAAEAAFRADAPDAQSAVAEALSLARRLDRPVVIADTQDNPGAGGDADTTGMLRALLAAGAEGAALGALWDPQTAAAAHAAGERATLAVRLGGRSGVAGDAPLEAQATVERLHHGRFRTRGPYYGDRELDLGPSACLRVGGVRVVVTSAKAQMADREMFRFVGIEPETARLLVVKSSVHFRADFTPIAGAILVAAAPGPMPHCPSLLPWRRLRPGLRTSPLGAPFAPHP